MENLLKKQLENSRFQHVVEYIKQSSSGVKKLNSNELAHINQMLTSSQEEPWRTQPIQLTLASGKVREFKVISNPVVQTREILSKAYEWLIDGKEIEAATHVYSQLVMGHFFRDANRRTAVAATIWILQAHGINVASQVLLENKIGDLHEPGELERLRKIISKNIS